MPFSRIHANSSRYLINGTRREFEQTRRVKSLRRADALAHPDAVSVPLITAIAEGARNEEFAPLRQHS